MHQCLTGFSNLSLRVRSWPDVGQTIVAASRCVAAATPYDELVSGRFDADHDAASIRERADTGEKKWILLH
jgi:hypothetical protein